MSGTATAPLTDPQADAVLNLISQALQIVPTCSKRIAPGSPLRATLVPPAPEIDASEFVNGILNLGWTAKDVIYNDANPLNLPQNGDLRGSILPTTGGGQAQIAGGEPFPPPLGVVGGPTASTLTNIAGVLNQIFGTIALPRLSVRIRINWRIVRKRWDGTVESTQEGVNFLAPSGLTSPTVSLLIPPPFQELRVDTLASPRSDLVCLYADVALTLGTRQLTRTLGPLPFLLLPLLIPTVVAIFTDENFGVSYKSKALIVVPEHSPLSSIKPLVELLRKIESVLDALRSIGGFAAWLLGLDELLDAIPEQPRIRFAVAADHPRSRQGIPKLGNIEIRPGPLFGLLPGETFDDDARSFIVFGLPGTTVNFYNDTFYKTLPATHQGMYKITIPDAFDPSNPASFPSLFVLCRDLSNPPDTSLNKPVTVPDGVVSFEPDTTDDDQDWIDSLSSLDFDKDWLDSVATDQGMGGGDPKFGCLDRPGGGPANSRPPVQRKQRKGTQSPRKKERSRGR